MKKIMKISAVLLMLLMAGALVAQDYYDDEPAPRRGYRRGGLLQRKTFSVGVIGSVLLKTDILNDNDDVIDSLKEESKKANIGLSARIYPFMGGKLGVGFSIIHLQTIEYDDGSEFWKMSEFLVDVDLLYRIKLGRRIIVNGGIGWSQYLTTWENTTAGTSDKEWGKEGFNLKIGGELFLSRNISATIDWKWTYFKYENFDDTIVPATDFITKRFHSVVIGLHYWL